MLKINKKNKKKTPFRIFSLRFCEKEESLQILYWPIYP